MAKKLLRSLYSKKNICQLPDFHAFQTLKISATVSRMLIYLASALNIVLINSANETVESGCKSSI